MKLAVPLDTPRLTLRTLDIADVGDAYIGWMRDPDVLQYLEVRFAPVLELDDLRSFVASANASVANYLFGMFRKSDGHHIGNIKLGPIIAEHARSEIGYLIGDRSCWGQSYASEAIARVTTFAFEDLQLQKVKAGCYETNVGSAKALLKAGFTQEATIPADCICDGRRVASLLFAINR